MKRKKVSTSFRLPQSVIDKIDELTIMLQHEMSDDEVTVSRADLIEDVIQKAHKKSLKSIEELKKNKPELFS